MSAINDNIVRLNNVTKIYGFRKILDSISMDVYRGEFLIVVGPSGSGKTTLLGIIAGLESPDEGEVYFEGRCIGGMNVDELAEYRNKHIGFIFQNYNLIPHLTAMENVMLPMIIAGLKENKAKRRALTLLKQFGVKDKAMSYPNELSGGEQQRVSVARALANDPMLILADEPTANLDRENEEIIMEFLSRTVSEGRTVILVTHKEYLCDYASRVYRLVDGRLVGV